MLRLWLMLLINKKLQSVPGGMHDSHRMLADSLSRLRVVWGHFATC
jgi:hypothetical protein